MFKVGDIVEITAEAHATRRLDFVSEKGYKVANVVAGMLRLKNESYRYGWYDPHHFKYKALKRRKLRWKRKNVCLK